MYLVAEGLGKILASKIEKGEDYIRVYDENGVVSRVFQGIPDFSKFSVEGGEFTPAPPDKLTRIQTAMSDISSSLAENNGILAIKHGGTGATTASAALTNLGAAAASHKHSVGDITSGTLPISRGGTGATTVSGAISNLDILNKVYPVGSIYMSVNSTNPSNYFGGTWVRWGQGRVPVGVNSSDSNFSTVEKTGGEKSHTLTTDELPSHTHQYYHEGVGAILANTSDRQSNVVNWGQETKTTGGAGGSAAHNNLQPYITCYMWKRTA